MLARLGDPTHRPILIAEIGNNHEGEPALALELAEAAMEAGADAVKVQVIDPPRLVNRAQADRIAQLSKFRLEPEVFAEIGRRVRRRGGMFVASVFDCDRLAAMASELDGVKIASGDLDFEPLLEVAAASGKPVILSTGMSTIDEISRAVSIIDEALPDGVAVKDRLTVLHCVSLYPTPPEQANLAAIPYLARSLGVAVGYSDHTLGVESAVAAVALGARIIEKHFTIDKSRSTFRDHALSAEPQEFAALARFMRSYPDMLGTGARDGDLADAATRAVARRSIVAARDLPAGAVLTSDDLDYVRPGGGLPPSEAKSLVGRRLAAAVATHHVFRPEDLA